jgi:hypothetical protein
MFFKNGLMSVGVAFFILGGLTACTTVPESADDPKHRLNEYISQSFAIKGAADRAVLAGYLTGEAKSRIQSWSDEQFRQAFMDAKRQFVKLAFKEEKTVSPTEMGITYELTYQTNYADAQGKSHDAKVTNMKLAQMVRENGKWLISDVRNIKELVEYKNEMSLP